MNQKIITSLKEITSLFILMGIIIGILYFTILITYFLAIIYNPAIAFTIEMILLVIGALSLKKITRFLMIWRTNR